MNAQPMGFYPPSSLVRDAQRRGVEVRPPHVNRSEAQCDDRGRQAVRVGLGYVQSVGEDGCGGGRRGQPVSRPRRPRASAVGEAATRSRRSSRPAPATSGGRGASCSGGSASRARGETVGGGNRQLALPLEPTAEIPELPEQTPWEQMLADYKHTSLSVGVHPLQLLRPHLPAGVATSAELADTPNGTRIEVAGMAIARQRPATANGIVFMLLEDEHGQANLIIPPQVYEEHRAIIRGEPLLLARGKLERHDRNVNLLVRRGRVARPARAPSGERGRGDARPAARAPLRPPVAEPGSAQPEAGSLGAGGAGASAPVRGGDRLYAELTRPTCVNACGKFPSRRFAAGSYSSESSPRSLRHASSRSNSARASSSRSDISSASTSQNEHGRNTPSPPASPSIVVVLMSSGSARRIRRASGRAGSRRPSRAHADRRGGRKPTSGISSVDASSSSEP